MKQSPGTLWLRILVVVLAVLLAAVVADRVNPWTPPRYLSTVTIQVRNPDAANPAPSLETTRELILRREVLEPVAQSLGLAGNDPVTALRRSINVGGVRHTELLRIEVAADTPADAARRANAVAEEFQRQAFASHKEFVARSLDQLKTEVEEQRTKAEAARAAAANIRMETGITDLQPGQEGEGGTLEEAIAAIKARAAELRATQKKLAALTDGQLLDEISRGTEFGKSLDPTLSEIRANLRLAENEIAGALAQGLGPDHPKVKAFQARADVMKKQLADLVPILRQRIGVSADREEAKLAQLEQFAAGSVPEKEAVERYRAAKQHYLREQKLLESVQKKLAEKSIDSTLPQNPVAIWERAEPPLRPDSRPRLLLAVSVLLGLVAGAGLAFLPRPGLVSLGLAALLLLAGAPRAAEGFSAAGPKVSPPPEPPARISVGGDVKAPQLLDYAPDLTLLRVINAAGGFSEYADQKKIRLLRDGKVIVVDVTAIRQDPSKDISLKPGDSIEVPQSFW
jgi:uncharacterized protein involved in exopolysaccharide biosynthesis